MVFAIPIGGTMKKIKLTGHQIKFLINMLSLALFAFSYLYIYTGYVDKTKAAYDEVDLTKQMIKTREKQIAEEDSIQKETQNLKTEIQAIIDNYPVNITKIDNLLFVQQLQNELGISLNTIIPTDSSPYFDTVLPMRNEDGTEVEQTSANYTTGNVTAETVTGEEQVSGLEDQEDTLDTVQSTVTGETPASETASGQTGSTITTAPSALIMRGLQSTITMNFQASYEDFKKLTKYIENYPDQTVIDSISVSADPSSGKLAGSLVLKRFALSGTGKVYEKPMIDDISIGTDNIFGTASDTEIESNTEQEETQQ
jgi:hypothetical protein